MYTGALTCQRLLQSGLDALAMMLPQCSVQVPPPADARFDPGQCTSCASAVEVPCSGAADMC